MDSIILAGNILVDNVKTIDIRMTKDLQLVIMHDAKVERTTEGKGVVEEMTFDEVTGLVMKRSREKSPSVQQVMDVFKGRADVDIELEMKAGGKFYEGENMEIYCRKLHDMAVATLKPGTYTFTSFNPKAIHPRRGADEGLRGHGQVARLLPRGAAHEGQEGPRDGQGDRGLRP